MLYIVGGTYLEYCIDPSYEGLYGSGLRAACALSDKGFPIHFYSCIGEKQQDSAAIACDTFNIESTFTPIAETVAFEYYHPLSKPRYYSAALELPKTQLADFNADQVLYYGMIEAGIKIKAEQLVYDPQNGIPFKDTGCSAKDLALVLNKNEALALSGYAADADLRIVGKLLLEQEKAKVVVIKNGPNGGLVVDSSGAYAFPVYDVATVWPIGSGDIFSAVFAWKWMMEKLPAIDAATLASRYTADYCGTQVLPLNSEPLSVTPVYRKGKRNKVYLAAPFFSLAERWLVRQIRNALLDFDNEVFSPLHDVDDLHSSSALTDKEIATLDLKGLEDADTILAVANGIDPGTMFEIGYGIAKNKKVVILVENINPNDLTMLTGSGCAIVHDIATAVYKSSW